MRVLPVLSVLVIALVLAGCYEPYIGYGFRSRYSAEDGRQIVLAILTNPDIKKVADRLAPLVVAAEVSRYDPYEGSFGWSETFQYLYADGKVTNATSGTADFTLTTTGDIVLDVINADDPLRVFACAIKAHYATLDATNVLYAASFNAAKGRILGSASHCAPEIGQTVTFRGLQGAIRNDSRGTTFARMGGSGGDFLEYNELTAPIRWLPPTYLTTCAGVENAKTQALVDQLCTGAGFSVPQTDLADCAAAVTNQTAAPGWSAGKTAWDDAKVAAEKAACKLLFGGS